MAAVAPLRSALLLLVAVPAPDLTVWRDAAAFTEAECRTHHGRRVRFTGTVADTAGGIEDLYPVYFDPPRNDRREWLCLPGHGDWLRVQPGQRVTVEGVLLLHEAEGGQRAPSLLPIHAAGRLAA